MSVTLHKYCCFGCVFLGATPIAQDAQYDNSDLSHLFFNVVRPESYQRHFGMVISFIYLPSLHMCPSQEHQQHYLSQTAQALWFSLKKRQQIIFLRKRGLNSQPALSRYICTFFSVLKQRIIGRRKKNQELSPRGWERSLYRAVPTSQWQLEALLACENGKESNPSYVSCSEWINTKMSPPASREGRTKGALNHLPNRLLISGGKLV